MHHLTAAFSPGAMYSLAVPVISVTFRLNHKNFKGMYFVSYKYLHQFRDLGDTELGVPGREKPGPDANNSLPRIPADA